MKRRNLVLTTLFFMSISLVHAQLLKPTFEQTKEQIIKESAESRQRVADYLKATGLQPVFRMEDGNMAYMVDVINGKPLYVASTNERAAANVGVANIRAGGSLGLNLTGDGLRLLVWDSPAGARITHQEFTGRLSHGSDIDLSSDTRASHSSHVTGTMLAGGVNSLAQGMAPQANGVAYGFTNHLPEMTEELTSNPESGILSNHSYAPISGWTLDDGEWTWFGDENVSTEEDWKFGFYNSEARGMDQLAHDSPFYTIVFAAGNDRNDVGNGAGDHPADGPYDLIPFYLGAKNIVTVGAINKLGADYEGPNSVEITSFSNWGPTDDGRIKPDIVAPGASIRSANASADDTYSVFSGTSQAAPVVTGGLALIQELNRDLTGNFMKSAALKGLMIHTAEEAGRADGPDYEYGWGLFNADGMAKLLIEENDDNINLVMGELTDGGTDTYTINPDIGTDVKVTLVWTDVPGTPTNIQLDPENLMLVNDLDMRVVGETDTQMPWVLNPAAPADAATKGDNFRDNVEKIEFTAVDGTYTININHKNSIEEGPQEYALIIEYVKSDASKNFYWVGNTGDWSDGANWSFSSGGEAVNSVPSALDNVIFDDNSFNGISEGQTFNIALQQDVNVGGLKWFANKEGDFSFGGNQITVGGDLSISGSGVSFGTGNVIANGQENGVLNFGSAFSTTNVIVNAGENGVYRLVNDVNINSIEVQSGQLVFENNEVTIGTMTLDGGSTSASNATINITGAFNLNTNHTISDFSGSKLQVPAEAQDVNFDFSNIDLPVNLTVLGTATITGNSLAELEIISTNSRVNTTSDFTTGSLRVTATNTLNIGNGTTFTVTGPFDASGATGNTVRFTSDDSANLNLTGHRKICAELLEIQGVNYTGESTVSIGENSTLAGGETGWNQVSCDNVLFADFGFDFGCANGLTLFNNLSSGQITSHAWNFGESGASVVDSEIENPAYAYQTPGVYDIKLTVTDANAGFELTRVSQIIENTIEPFVINEPAEGVLVSDITGETYQWYLNGNPLSGIAATNRQLVVTQSGIYTVLVSDETCNRFSNEFTFQVTSIDIDSEEQEKVEEAVNVFPNPTRDYIDVTIEGYALKRVAMELVDQSGKVVTNSLHDNINSQSFSERLKVSDMRQGFYILRFVVNENIIVNRKVILTD